MQLIADKIYHGVELENVRLPDHIVEWLNDRVGTGRWFLRGNLGGQTLYFESEKDHFLFLLTWGQRG